MAKSQKLTMNLIICVFVCMNIYYIKRANQKQAYTVYKKYTCEKPK